MYMYSNCYLKCVYIYVQLLLLHVWRLNPCVFSVHQPLPNQVFVLLPTIRGCTCHLQRYSLYHNQTIQKVNSWLWCICCIMLTTAWTSEEGLINPREKGGKKKERKKKKKGEKKEREGSGNIKACVTEVQKQKQKQNPAWTCLCLLQWWGMNHFLDRMKLCSHADSDIKYRNKLAVFVFISWGQEPGLISATK